MYDQVIISSGGSTMTAFLRRLFSRRVPVPTRTRQSPPITELDLLRALGCDE
ncbi:hypothetical protein DEIGR_102484 [Deinococcus grandis]|uniref:Uncharacterized protein n=1 Tax=Deinococcus grandis TaxID=57498 RepID=A0A117DNX1_9DEIO|nr:hypothetical protein DEGR_07680 [Deinococcus grandis]GAQ22457.1 hypothetical protein DEIGR_102484 [Deinococcus grandis]